jgi:F-type H+-transporting ATPase subunit a
MKLALRSLFLVVFCFGLTAVNAQQDGPDQEDHSGEDGHGHGTVVHEGCAHDDDTYDPASVILHHIADANYFEIIHGFNLPLPLFLYAPGHGLTTGLSSMLGDDHHLKAVEGYVMNHGRVNRLADSAGEALFTGEHEVECIIHKIEVSEKGKEVDTYYAKISGQEYLLKGASVGDGGLLGGGITNFYDFSITKNVFTMLLASLLLIFLWTAVARGYKRNEGQAPSGIQSLMEPFFVFLRDEISIPMIGEKHYAKFQPFIMTVFFFILFCNLFGLIPFIPGSANVTGNIAVTMALAVIAAIVAYVHGNGHFWGHVFWMPGVPVFVKPLLTVVEVLGLVIKPFSLMIRLFANITAGHIIILSLISLIFIFGNNGESVMGAAAGGVVGVAFTLFINCIELLVAFVQPFIFAILAASYIGAAVEEHEHEHEGEKSHNGDHENVNDGTPAYA